MQQHTKPFGAIWYLSSTKNKKITIYDYYYLLAWMALATAFGNLFGLADPVCSFRVLFLELFGTFLMLETLGDLSSHACSAAQLNNITVLVLCRLNVGSVPIINILFMIIKRTTIESLRFMFIWNKRYQLQITVLFLNLGTTTIQHQYIISTRLIISQAAYSLIMGNSSDYLQLTQHSSIATHQAQIMGMLCRFGHYFNVYAWEHQSII